MNPLRKSDKRRSFLELLTKQLAVPYIEERATNPRITCYPKIRSAMETFDVVVLQRPQQGAKPEFAPRTNRWSCHLSRQQYHRQRKTRSKCYNCQLPVCTEHSHQLARCATCQAAAMPSTPT
ncbi:hypothetical protein FQA39_LY00704 [Lamprigera yunnana]|nr:hypothetical protein FQA39_LY00704 [Lamprigera yunnana]